MEKTAGRDGIDAAIRHLYEGLIDAWNRRDAKGYAALFRADALMVGFDGTQVSGDTVADHLAPIFAGHPTARYVTKIRTIRRLGPDHAMMWAIVGMVPPGGNDINQDVNAVQTMVAERQGATWRIVLFQNTAAQYHGRPEVAEQHTEELRRLL